MKKLTVNIGERFNHLTVIEMTGVNSKGFSMAKCRCDCGNVVEAKIAELRSGRRKSCGCTTLNSKSDKAAEEIVGKKFGRLTVISLDGLDEKHYKMVLCQCDCGKKVRVRQATVLRGELQSCGCLLSEKRLENIVKAQTACVKHGLTGTLTGQSWISMIQRCYNPNCDSYERYGKVGIKCCESLKASPWNILWAIGDRPSKEMTLDRIDGKLGYYCGMCGECISNGWKRNIRWATNKEQCRNRSSNHYVEIDGMTRTIVEWYSENNI